MRAVNNVNNVIHPCYICIWYTYYMLLNCHTVNTPGKSIENKILVKKCQIKKYSSMQ